MPSVVPTLPVLELYGDYYERDASYGTFRNRGSGDYLMIYTASGSGRFVGPKGVYDTRKGDVILYAPSDLHDYRTEPKTGTWKLYWAHFVPKPGWQSWLNWPVNLQGLKATRLGTNEVLRHFSRAMRDVVLLSRRPRPEAMDLAINALESALIWARTTFSQDRWYAMDSRVRAAIDYLVGNWREPFSMTELARHGGLSPSRLAHLFKDVTGTSPQQFLETYRIQQACSLLRITNRTITEIAADVGYHDPFYFTNRFRRHLQSSPTEFRRRSRTSSPKARGSQRRKSKYY
jgi:AraC family transcriptional regulator of arabinose operon